MSSYFETLWPASFMHYRASNSGLLAFVPLMRPSAPRLSGGAWHRPSFCSADDAKQCRKDGQTEFRDRDCSSPARRSARLRNALLSSCARHRSDDCPRGLDTRRGGPSFRKDKVEEQRWVTQSTSVGWGTGGRRWERNVRRTATRMSVSIGVAAVVAMATVCRVDGVGVGLNRSPPIIPR